MPSSRVSPVLSTWGIGPSRDSDAWDHFHQPSYGCHTGIGTKSMTLLANIGAAITLILGCLGLLFPDRVSRIVGVSPVGPLGKSELRATYGGFFLCLGAGCLITQSDTAFLVAGSAWIGSAIARLISVAADKSHSRENLVGIFFEATVGLMMLSTIFKFS
jgi:hypothetical protein